MYHDVDLFGFAENKSAEALNLREDARREEPSGKSEASVRVADRIGGEADVLRPCGFFAVAEELFGTRRKPARRRSSRRS